MSEKQFWNEFTHLLFVATAVTFFAIFFIIFGRIGLSKIHNPGLQEVFSAA